jgi:ADP-heptose:LPS heptosyltransferase
MPQIMPERVKNILCVRNDRFGEFLLNIPAFRALKETFSGARLTVVIDPYIKDLAQSIPFIDDVIFLPAKANCTFGRKLQLIGSFRKKKFDMALMLNPSKDFNIFTYLSGIPIRVGYARKWSFLLTHKMQDTKHLGDRHEVECNLELAGLVGASTEDKTLSLAVDDAIINSLYAEQGIKSSDVLVALHPWTSDPVKQWPKDNFRRLAGMLLENKDVKVVIVGGKEEVSGSGELFKEFSTNPNFLDLTGRTTFKQLAAILKKAKLLISGDSGPVHLGSAVGCKVIAIFRSDLAGKTSKRWGPWGAGHRVIEGDDLSKIKVEEVYRKAMEGF